MKTIVINRIKELNDGKVVRFFKNGCIYKFAKMETMCSIVMRPTPYEDECNLLENIQMTGYCSLTEAELLIEHLFN